MNYKNKSKRPQRRKNPKVSKSVKQVVKQMINKEIETKTINVANPSGLSNNNNVPYLSLSGLQYLVTDAFKMKQGTGDSTVVSPFNRIGDKIRAIGLLMDYYFTIPSKYTLAGNAYNIPFVKLRITVFTTAFGLPILSSGLLYDGNFNTVNTSTLQPINWDEGYVKEVLYDQVHIIRSNYPGYADQTGQIAATLGNVFHFKKYLKLNDRPIKYMDNNSTTPNNTDKPIYITISAEVDDAATGLVPSGSTILYSTGYTRGWFKDA